MARSKKKNYKRTQAEKQVVDTVPAEIQLNIGTTTNARGLAFHLTAKHLSFIQNALKFQARILPMIIQQDTIEIEALLQSQLLEHGKRLGWNNGVKAVGSKSPVADVLTKFAQQLGGDVIPHPARAQRKVVKTSTKGWTPARRAAFNKSQKAANGTTRAAVAH